MAASPANLVQCGLLITLLSLPLLAAGAPEISWLGVHPLSFLVPAGYILGQWLASRVSAEPSWHPHQTPQTQRNHEEAGEAAGNVSLTTSWLWARFAGLAIVLAGCGYLVGETGVLISDRTGISETAVGTLVTAVSTSLPELVTAVAAVRSGFLILAVGDILGGNAFDTVLIGLSDFVSPDPIFAALDAGHYSAIGLGQLLTGLVLLGLIRRQPNGFANIGFESWASLLAYAVGAFFIFNQ